MLAAIRLPFHTGFGHVQPRAALAGGGSLRQCAAPPSAICDHRKSQIVTLLNTWPYDGVSDDADACSHGQSFSPVGRSVIGIAHQSGCDHCLNACRERAVGAGAGGDSAAGWAARDARGLCPRRTGLPAFAQITPRRTLTIEGPAGPIGLRILVPDEVRGVYLHIHGGGWIVGSNDTWDEQLDYFGREAGMVAVSLDYRLAPEHPAPAAIDDCVAVASWLIAHVQPGIRHVLAVDRRRIRRVQSRRPDAAPAPRGRERRGLQGSEPAVRRLRSVTHPQRISGEGRTVHQPRGDAAVREAFAEEIDLKDPALSPLYADLHDLPPALFSVGSVKSLLDDSLFMFVRWPAAGNFAHLAVYPGGTHGFNTLGGELAAAGNWGIATFLKAMRTEAAS